MALLITLLLGLFLLAGMLVIKYAPNHERIEHLSYAIAFGAMAGLVFLDLIPEIAEEFEGMWIPAAPFIVAAGIGLLMILDRFIPEHEHADEDHPIHIGIMATIAIILHNLIEGMTVYSICDANPSSGLVLAIGVGLHNIPMGMLIYSTLKTETRTKRWTLMTLASLATFFGGVLMMVLQSVSPDALINVLMCLTLGMILYIVVFELLPLLLRSRDRIWNLIGVVAGLAIVFISTFLE